MAACGPGLSLSQALRCWEAECAWLPEGTRGKPRAGQARGSAAALAGEGNALEGQPCVPRPLLQPGAGSLPRDVP